jgi:allantoin racemase
VISTPQRILDLLPVVYTDGLKGAMADRKELARALSTQTNKRIRLEFDSLSQGTVSIEDAYDEAVNEPYILEKVKLAEKNGFSAVVIDCFGDPALDAARELVRIPVVGVAQSACHLAAQLAPRFSIINTVPEFVHIDRSLVVKYGLSEHLASVITINIPVLSLEAHAKRTVTTLVNAVKKAATEDGAQAVVLGCTGMSSLMPALQKRVAVGGLDLPIIEPLRAAVYNAVAWVLAGHSQSKEAYKEPRRKKRVLASA